MATTRKKPTASSTTADEAVFNVTKTTEDVKAETKTEEVKEVKGVKEVKAPAMTDLILCRSTTIGGLGLIGLKSKMPYEWSNMGDECEVEYQDLLALLSTKSRYLFDPLFIIENDDLLSLTRWKPLKEFYDNMYTLSDVEAVLNLPINKFKAALKKLPKGLANAVKTTAASKIEAGTFDSIVKIKALDEILDTDFMCLIK